MLTGVILALGVAFAGELDRPVEPLSVPDDCTWENARRISLKEMARDYLELYGECVRTSGWTNGISIGTESGTFSQYDFAVAGIFWANRPLLTSLVMNIEAFGVVGACEYLCPPVEETVNPDGSMSVQICMPPGVCHWTSRYPYLLAGDYRIVSPTGDALPD